MYKLTIVAGPESGSTYNVQDGENSIGRQPGNAVVINSGKVSKKHCVLVAVNGELVVKDLGSSNGTYVNGVLTKARKVNPGDRISVGEVVLEISRIRQAAAPAALGGIATGTGNVIQFPGQFSGAQHAPAVPHAPVNMAPPVPTDLKGKALFYFDAYVMPFFYGLNIKHEWRILAVGMFAAFILANLVISVYPLIESGRKSVVRESARRAQFMARQIVERNAPHLAQRAESKTEIGSIDREDGVQMAVLTDLDSRIIAPTTKLNQYLTNGTEAQIAVQARNAFRGGRETGFVKESGSYIIAIEPVKVLHPQAGKNVVVGMAIVSLDTTLSTPDMGEMGLVYSETLILTGILGALMLLILYRLTLKPFVVLNEDIDQVLKGDIGQVTHEFKFEELDSLWDVINSALQRVPRAGSGGGLGGDALGGDGGLSAEDIAGPLKGLGGLGKFGLVVLDGNRRILYLNPVFEEISGIRSENAIGQEIGSVARDQALGSLSSDLLERAPVGGEGVIEDFDFSGVSYRVVASAIGQTGSPAKCFILAAVKAEG